MLLYICLNPKQDQERSQAVANSVILVLWDTTFFRNIQKKSTSCLAFTDHSSIMSTCFPKLWTPTI